MKKTTLVVPAGSANTGAFLAEARVSGRASATLSIQPPYYAPGADAAADDAAAYADEPVPGRNLATAEATPAEEGGTAQPESGAWPGEEAPYTVIEWNPLSFASGRAAIIEAETMLGGRLDELVIIADPHADTAGLSSLSPKELESAVLAWGAGHAELIREAARRFEVRGGGTIVLAVVHADRGPLGAMAEGALLGLAEGILATGLGSVRFAAIRDESGQAETLARHLMKALDEPSRDSGRIQRIGGRQSLFGRS